MAKPNLVQCDVRAATHVMTLDGLVHKIASKWGIDENGFFTKGGFGVVTEAGQRIGMMDAKRYFREPEDDLLASSVMVIRDLKGRAIASTPVSRQYTLFQEVIRALVAAHFATDADRIGIESGVNLKIYIKGELVAHGTSERVPA